MGLWVAFGFGALIGAFIGALVGRHRAARGAPAPAPVVPPPPTARFGPAEVRHVVLDEGSANVLNALNNRLAAIGALADLLHGSPLDPERARALMMLHGEVRRAAEITQHFLELAQHRSEEHTSELQSRRDLVCRLLLEKKKKKKTD